MAHPVLPPSADFAAYLASPYHIRRMSIGKQEMLRRMRNFHSTEVFGAISEALGAIAALGEFYGGPPSDDRSLTGRITGDPSPRRPTIGLDEETIDLDTGKVLQPQQVRLVRFLSDGDHVTPLDLLRRAGSRATEGSSAAAAIRNLKAALSGSGMVIETDVDGRIFMPRPSCVLAQAIVGVA